jgi:uncharacterized membrane protein
MDRTRLAYWVTLTGFFGLFFSLLLWVGWLNTTPKLPRSLTLILTLGPLMFPLRGLLHAKPYTFSWSMFLALFYFVLGIVNVAVADTRMIGLLEIIFSLLFFLGALFFARWERA